LVFSFVNSTPVVVVSICIMASVETPPKKESVRMTWKEAKGREEEEEEAGSREGKAGKQADRQAAKGGR
jgi:hypothetical protein